MPRLWDVGHAAPSLRLWVLYMGIALAPHLVQFCRCWEDAERGRDCHQHQPGGCGWLALLCEAPHEHTGTLG